MAAPVFPPTLSSFKVILSVSGSLLPYQLIDSNNEKLADANGEILLAGHAIFGGEEITFGGESVTWQGE